MNFNPWAFVQNLSYMGKGMIGIFVAIGLIILCTAVLNRISSKKSDR